MINGRKADLKKAEPKQGGPFIPQKEFMNNGYYSFTNNLIRAPAMIAPYGSHNRDSSKSSDSKDQHENGRSRRSDKSDSERVNKIFLQYRDIKSTREDHMIDQGVTPTKEGETEKEKIGIETTIGEEMRGKEIETKTEREDIEKGQGKEEEVEFA